MNLNELIATLTEARDALGGDVAVQIAAQPDWPLRHEVATITWGQFDYDADAQVFIAAGGHPYNQPYAPRTAWDGGEVIDTPEE